LSIIALVFWSLHELFPVFKNGLIQLIEILYPFSGDYGLEGGSKRSLIIYTFIFELEPMSFGINRNSGFAHEPGAFAVFLNFALFINYIKGKSLFYKRNIVYIAATITTFSTAGYLSVFIILIMYLLKGKYKFISIFFIPLIFFYSLKMFNELEFLGGKINYQIEDQTQKNLNERTTGRLYGARKSINVLMKYPFYGRGLLSVTRPDSTSDSEYAEYGWLSQIARFGLIIGLLGLYFFIKGFKVYASSFGSSNLTIIGGLICLFINFSSQTFITHPIFFVLFYFGLYYKLPKSLPLNKKILAQIN
jgi:hypothetical protein